jgi:uncharacterized membrane protein
MMQIIVVAGVCIVLLGMVWMVTTLPSSYLIEEMQLNYGYSASAATSVYAQKIFISALPLLIGFGVMAWGFIKNNEEREMGYVQL